MPLQTSYEFTLPRGYVDPLGRVHAKGTMRLATARDELEPLRDVTIRGPEDPQLTILVLTRVIETLGEIELITSTHIENLFAVDLAYLQDFYGVINFGTQAEYDALMRSQQEMTLVGSETPTPREPEVVDGPSTGSESGGPATPERRPTVRAAVEEIRRQPQ